MNPAIILLAALAGSPRPADGPNRDELVAEAIEHYEHGDHAEAIAAFERAYAKDQLPVDLYNIGRLYEETGQPQMAREYYRRFLAHPDISPEERREGKARLRDLPPPPETEPKATEASAESAPPPRRPRPHWAVVTGATLIPAGAASLLSGGLLARAAIANGRIAEESATAEVPLEQTPHYTLGRRQAITADVLLGVGGTLAATGVAVLTVGLVRRRKPRRQADDQPRLAVTPLGAGLRVDVRF